jgi:hypothetical protein
METGEDCTSTANHTAFSTNVEDEALNLSQLEAAAVPVRMAARAAKIYASHDVTAVSWAEASPPMFGNDGHGRVVGGRKRDSKFQWAIVIQLSRLSQVLPHPDIALRSTACVVFEWK